MANDLETTVMNLHGSGVQSSWLDRLARKLVAKRLDGVRSGRIVIREGGAKTGFGPRDRGLRATLWVRDRAFWRHLAFGGAVGAARSFARGDWECDDLTALIRILARDRETNRGIERGTARVSGWLDRIRHRFRDNTRSGSRRNIAEHYDLGNDFFAEILDPTMTYSCAIFESEHDSLEDASRRKLDRVCRKLQLTPEHEVLEIGTGWGSFALHAATEYGCRVTSTTISKAQFEEARKRVAAAGLEDRVELLLCDYRDLPALGRKFDRLVSIEMIEAVGERHLDEFVQVCGELLKPDGMLVLQAITIADRLYEAYRTGADVIQRLIFPGSFLPGLSDLMGRFARRTDLRLIHLEDLTPHYVTTLERWRSHLEARRNSILELGYPEELLRLWTFYFCYCAGGFAERTIGDVQLLMEKPQSRRSPINPALFGEALR